MRKILALTLVAGSLFVAPAAAQTDLGPLNLPGSFASMPFSDNFEAAAGTVPGYMALTELDALLLTADPEAWANVGNRAACLNPFDGSFNLEMGLDPNSSNYHDVRNAMVIGLDATGYTGNTTVSFYGIDGGEELDTVDGVWVSDTGVGASWYPITGDWGSTFGPTNTWEFISGIDWSTTPVNTSGQFYMAFVQEDNFPYLDLDGIGIDVIDIPSGLKKPELSVLLPLQGGAYAALVVSSDQPGGSCQFLASLAGGGPGVFNGIAVDLSAPIITLPNVATDVNGDAVLVSVVPAFLSGSDIWLQSIVTDVSGSLASTSTMETIQ